jgi:hypothetical protein
MEDSADIDTSVWDVRKDLVWDEVEPVSEVVVVMKEGERLKSLLEVHWDDPVMLSLGDD